LPLSWLRPQWQPELARNLAKYTLMALITTVIARLRASSGCHCGRSQLSGKGTRRFSNTTAGTSNSSLGNDA
jgi:hypothetical protein